MTPYIIKALQKGDSICVNDLGTFSLHYVPANISGKVISAPHNIVTFEAHSGSVDYAFTDLVCFEKKCLITQASNDITQWVEELKQALNHNKSVTFEGFGTFSLNDKGKISFSCDHIPELNLEFEGLQDLQTENLWKVESGELRVESEEPETEDQRPETTDEIPDNVMLEEEKVESEEPSLETEEQRPETTDVMPDNVMAEEENVEPEDEPVIYRSDLWKEEEEKVESEETRPETEDEIPDNVMPEEEENTDDTKKRKSRWWLWLLLVLLLLAALGAAGYLFRDQLRPVYDNVKEKFSKKEKVETPAETETIEVITPAEEVEPEEEVVEEVPEEPAVYTPE